MQLTKASIISGNVTIDGFRLDGNYIASEPIPNYLIWEFRGHEENTIDSASFVNASGFDCELVSLIGGTHALAPTEVQLTTMTVQYQPVETPSTYPNNFVFYHNFGNAFLPISFPQGLLIPNGSRVTVTFTTSLTFVRVVAVPRLVVQVGNIVVYP